MNGWSGRARSGFRLRRRVHFHETDKAGIVHFSWYFRYMEEAEHALWRSVGLSISPPEAEIGWPRVQAAFDYHSALRFEEEFEIRIRIVAMSASTISYACVLSRGDTRVASGSMTIVCVRKRPGHPMRATPIPAEVAARFRVASGAGRRTS